MRIILALALMLAVTACSTVAGMGQDIKGAAEWTHDKMTQPAKQDPAR